MMKYIRMKINYQTGESVLLYKVSVCVLEARRQQLNPESLFLLFINEIKLRQIYNIFKGICRVQVQKIVPV